MARYARGLGQPATVTDQNRVAAGAVARDEDVGRAVVLRPTARSR